MTNLALTSSEEVKKEIQMALYHRNNKKIIPCLHNHVSIDKFEQIFPGLKGLQRIIFKDEYDLANKITSVFSNYYLT